MPMAQMDTVRIGLVGSGFAARLHAEAYAQVSGIQPVLAVCASIDPKSGAFAAQYGISKVCADYRELLSDPTIDIIDIVTPPAIHSECVLEALRSGKHVICEKPLTGYFGAPGDPQPIGLHVPRGQMLRQVMGELDALSEAVTQAKGKFMYAENWIYMPALQKAAEVIRTRGMRLLYMRGEESHSGSHAPHAAHFSQNGGGALIRQGVHPVSALLYLKQVEAKARQVSIGVQSVLCSTAVLTEHLPDSRSLDARPVDVEDWAQCTITFTDGTKADILAADVLLGGTKNQFEIYADSGVIQGNVSPNNALQTYFPDDIGLDSLYLTEKTQNKAGWQHIFLDEMRSRGYVDELQDFLACAATDRAPLSDFALAADTTRVIYAAYLSAEQGRRVDMDKVPGIPC